MPQLLPQLQKMPLDLGHFGDVFECNFLKGNDVDITVQLKICQHWYCSCYDRFCAKLMMSQLTHWHWESNFVCKMLKKIKGTVMIFLCCAHRVKFITFHKFWTSCVEHSTRSLFKSKFLQKIIELTLSSEGVGWKTHTCSLKYLECIFEARFTNRYLEHFPWNWS